jgi:flagellar basal-body rod protein FlgF
MDQISVIAASGLRASMQTLDLLANNMANSSTNGYKADGEFYSLYTSETAEGEINDPPATMPMIERQWTDFAQGLLETTNNPFDFGLSGKGFFVANGPSGPLYTRNGTFHVTTDGTLVTSDRYPLLDQNDQPITAELNVPINVATDGTIYQRGQVLTQLKVVNFKDTSVLFKQGNNYFKNTSDQKPVDATDIEVHQGQVEDANTSPAKGAVRLVNIMRQFEMMQKAVSISNDMNQKAIQEVARVS